MHRRPMAFAVAAVAIAATVMTTLPADAAPPPPGGPAGPPTASELFEQTESDLLALQKSRGSRAALRELGRRVQRNPRLEGVCHPIAHALGHAAVQEAGGGPRSASAALRDRDDVCGGGFTHGVIESALGSSVRPERDLLVVCAPANDGSCFHGVGHGLMFATGMRVGRSLRLCDRAPTTTLSHRCGEGVFMQLFSADLAAHHGADASVSGAGEVSRDPARAGTACRDTRGDYALNCWFYAPTVWLTVHPDDFTGAMDWCRAEAAGSGRDTCAKGVGSRTVKYHPDDLSIGAAVCAAAGRLTDPCLQGMGSYWSVHHRGRREPVDVCRHLTDKDLTARCRQVLV